MATYSVIMFPGPWEQEEEAFRVAQSLSGILKDMPFDIAKRMRDTGFPIQKTRPEVATKCVEAVRVAGYRAASIAEPVAVWRYPEVRFAGTVGFGAERLDYEAGQFRDSLSPDDLLFLHMCAFPAASGAAGSLGTADGGRSEQVCLDLHCRDPRVIVRMDIKTTRYSFPEDGDERASQAAAHTVLAALNRFAHGKVVLPDAQLSTAPVDGEVWERAVLPNQATLRTKGAWFRRLAEAGLLKDVAVEAHRRIRGVGQSARVTAKDVGAAAAEGGEYAAQLAEAQKWLRRGLVKRALKEVEKAITMKPDRSEGYVTRAEIHERSGNSAAAERDRERATDLGGN